MSKAFSIFYGLKPTFVDVTEMVIQLCVDIDGFINLPAGDLTRYNIFKQDPLPGVVKTVMFLTDDQNETIYDDRTPIRIKISELGTPHYVLVQNIHSKYPIQYGSWDDELPEQKLTMQYLNPSSTVLELGSNIGRNTIIISEKVKNNHLVTLESHTQICEALEKNKTVNGLDFIIECSALSYRPLIQNGWDTLPDSNNYLNWIKVNTITFEELETKYNKKFDTLVADCEGALYYILQDNPSILRNISTVIMENDYHDINQKLAVDACLKKFNLVPIHRQAGGWGPCQDRFYEVWRRPSDL